MTLQESREAFIDSIASERVIHDLKNLGIYDNYITGLIDFDDVCRYMRDQAV